MNKCFKGEMFEERDSPQKQNCGKYNGEITDC